MARHYIGFTSKGPAVFKNVHKDETGRPLVLMEEDEQARLELDFLSYLETGESVSSATVNNDSITVTVATASPLVTLTMSGAKAYGETTVTVTFSTGDKWVGKIRIRNKRRYTISQKTSDYGETHA